MSSIEEVKLPVFSSKDFLREDIALDIDLDDIRRINQIIRDGININRYDSFASIDYAAHKYSD